MRLLYIVAIVIAISIEGKSTGVRVSHCVDDDDVLLKAPRAYDLTAVQREALSVLQLHWHGHGSARKQIVWKRIVETTCSCPWNFFEMSSKSGQLHNAVGTVDRFVAAAMSRWQSVDVAARWQPFEGGIATTPPRV